MEPLPRGVARDGADLFSRQAHVFGGPVSVRRYQRQHIVLVLAGRSILASCSISCCRSTRSPEGYRAMGRPSRDRDAAAAEGREPEHQNAARQWLIAQIAM